LLFFPAPLVHLVLVSLAQRADPGLAVLLQFGNPLAQAHLLDDPLHELFVLFRGMEARKTLEPIIDLAFVLRTAALNSLVLFVV
jgi:hypothetical protein